MINASQASISAIFAPNLRSCSVLVNGFRYDDLRVKWIKDIPKEGLLFVVMVPCAPDLGRNIMVAFDWEATQGYRHSFRK